MATAGMEGNHDESNRCIDIGLKEMNLGNYEKAVKFLKKANSLYPSPRATELIDLITKLRSSSNSNGSGDDNKQNNHQKSSSSPPSSPRKRKQNSSPSKSNTDSTRTTTNNDFTNDQYILVQKVKKCKTFYEVLNVTKEATDSEIKKAYKKLALQLHPDKNHAPGAVEAFKTVGNAVAVLTDARKRKEYDALSVEAASPNRNHFQSAFTRHHTHHSFEAAFERESDISAEELFNMFFGGFPAQRRYAGGTAAGPQRSYYGQQESGTQPSLAFGLILVLILISMLSSILTSDPVYSLLPSSKYPIKRETQNLAVPYYVRENFQNEYQGSLVRLENSVEEDYIFTQKQNCYRETSYRKAMMSRARSFGSRSQLAQATALKTPSCDNLSKIGITRYSMY